MINTIKSANSTFPAQKILIYGVQGLGKTTFGATFRNPVLLPTEEGYAAIDIPTFPLATSHTLVESSINSLIEEKHDFKTLLIDSLDWLEPLVWDACCKHHNQQSIESFGYGKGYVELDRWWRFLMQGFDILRREKNMDIVVLAHSEIKTITPPDMEPYDCYQIKMQKRAFALWQEWADMVLFCNYKVNVHKSKTGTNDERVRGIGTGDRVIYTSERPAWKAKSRWTLPDEILIGKDKQWSAFHNQLEAATNGKYINPNNKEK